MAMRFLFSSGSGDSAVYFGLLVMRVAFGGAMFLGHGMGKLSGLITNWSGMTSKFPAVVVNSQVSAVGAVAAESLFALLLVLGVATRFSALVLAFTMGVAAFVVHAGDPLFLGPGVTASKEPALIYMFAFVVLAITGGGRYALDSRLR
ncbi:DoxX family protein [Sulfuriroseicoccus oceanibius]|uniref:DoxX family protein n=1 Tax=Sulfuriroseicoccus oceanibius TaxID=2707525 RepID=A0A6B3L911_9BACT|nr:DoxX family protein [Sulfuriroseicoccus oceanibius]QQL44345.1 DoxX family protein [Sulfuriroseicoccus oceanibius]